MFTNIEPIPNLSGEEAKTLEFWKKLNVVEKLKKLRKGKKEKVYYDGPITTNNIPHYGHAITWTMKDIYPRFWSMQGFYVERNMGWDTKGILVEYEVEKELGFVKKEDIKKFGEAKFIEYCRTFVQKYKDAMFGYEEKLGRWFDKSATYSTADSSFVESEWWSLAQLYKKGLLYEGYKVVAYSTRAGMTLSSHEVAEGGYKEVEDPFVTVKFLKKNEPNTYFLAWTTTPWTIPGNLMLAVNKKLVYVRVACENETFILAKDRVKDVFKEKKYEIKEEFSGSKLEGEEYLPPFDYFKDKRKEGCFRVLSSAHASSEEGTGIVHLAPYGEEDFEIFMKLGIKLFDYLDETANFTSLIPSYQGMFYKDANGKIITDLKSINCLFDSGTLLHRMPICYRTGTPLIYKPVKSWYIAVSKLKKKMQSENQKINWNPKHLKNGNSKIWIENARDWALSRSRYWGTPLPLWINDKTQEKVFIGSFAELTKLTGKKVVDPHRPFIDDFTWEDKKNGGVFKRVKDVIDVWYDSGSMPFAQLNYPFKNKNRLNKVIPAEYISEGPDQVRLWFYTMHVLGVALFNKAPYKNVITIGTMLDEHGKKMSKSKRNYKPMDEVLAEYGADALRFFILTSPIVNGEDAIFSVDSLRDTKKDFFLTLWNCLRYFVTYANVNKFKPSTSTSKNVLDRWILLRLAELGNGVIKGLNNYNVLEASRLFQPFVKDLSTWYIRRSRDRLKEGDTQALNTLHKVLSDLSILLAPFVPFFAENLYAILQVSKKTKLPSVHFCLYPKSKPQTAGEKKLLSDMLFVMKVVELGHSERKASSLKVRQPLAKITIIGASSKLSPEVVTIIKDELNVKEVKFVISTDEVSVELDTVITEELKLEGLAREFIRTVQDLRKEKKVDLKEKIKLCYVSTPEFENVLAMFSKIIKTKAGIKELVAGEKLDIL